MYRTMPASPRRNMKLYVRRHSVARYRLTPDVVWRYSCDKGCSGGRDHYHLTMQQVRRLT